MHRDGVPSHKEPGQSRDRRSLLPAALLRSPPRSTSPKVGLKGPVSNSTLPASLGGQGLEGLKSVWMPFSGIRKPEDSFRQGTIVIQWLLGTSFWLQCGHGVQAGRDSIRWAYLGNSSTVPTPCSWPFVEAWKTPSLGTMARFVTGARAESQGRIQQAFFPLWPVGLMNVGRTW